MLEHVRKVPSWKDLPTIEEALEFEKKHELVLDEILVTIEFHPEYFQKLHENPVRAYYPFLKEQLLTPLSLTANDGELVDVLCFKDYLGEWDKIMEILKNDDDDESMLSSIHWNLQFGTDDTVTLYANNRIFLYDLTYSLKDGYYAVSLFAGDTDGFLRLTQVLSTLIEHVAVKSIHNGFTITSYELDEVLDERMNREEQDVI